VISERTRRLYEEHPPQPREQRPEPTLSELIHEVEVAAKFNISREELTHQLGVDRSLLDALIADTGIEFR
jgi:hypothetical protein